MDNMSNMSKEITLKDRVKEMTIEQKRVFDILIANGWVEGVYNKTHYANNSGKCHLQNKAVRATWCIKFDYHYMHIYTTRYGHSVSYTDNLIPDKVIEIMLGKRDRSEMKYILNGSYGG